MRLASARRQNACRVHRCTIGIGRILRAGAVESPQMPGGAGESGGISGGAHRHVLVGRHLTDVESVGGFTPCFPEDDAIADMKRRAALQIGQCEIHPAVASIGSPQQCKQSLVLVDGQELSVTKGPAFGREIKTYNPDSDRNGVAMRYLL